MPSRRLLVILGGALVALLVVGFGLYPLVLNQAKDLPDDISRSYHSVSNGAAFVRPDVSAACDPSGTPRAGAGLTRADLVLDETMTTRPGPKKTSVDISGTWALTSPAARLVAIEDRVTVSKQSTFPVADPTAETSWTSVWPAWCGEHAGTPAPVRLGPEVQQGLRYAFPFITDPRSYTFYEPLTHGYMTLDFVDRHDIPRIDASGHHSTDTLRVFEFRSGDYVAELAADRPAPPGALRAFAHINRTVFVEPRTGVIVDKHTRILIGYAHSQEEARTLFQQVQPADLDNPAAASRRLVLYGDFGWDTSTQAAQQGVAIPVIERLQWARVIAWVAKMGALAVAMAAVVMVRRAPHRNPVTTDKESVEPDGAASDGAR